MKLTWALRVMDGVVVAVVGGGGKTSLLYRLAAELAEPGTGRVIVTTTARMLLPREGDADGLFLHRDFDRIAERHAETLPYLRRIVVAPDMLDSDEGWKLDSTPLDWPRRLAGLPRVANVLVEADAASRPSRPTQTWWSWSWGWMSSASRWTPPTCIAWSASPHWWASPSAPR